MSIVVKVHLMDRALSFKVEENTTMEKLRLDIINKILLLEDGCFALFEKRDEWERCLDSEERPYELQQQWEKEKEKKKDAPEPKFIFKKKIFLRDEDREMKDPVAKELLYAQALHCIIDAEYPTTQEEAVTLAGLQVQVLYGEHNANTHIPGFFNNTIKNFIPKTMLGNKPTKEWEQLIFKQHRLNARKTEEDAKTEYLDIVRQFEFYGTTFYPPCKTISKSKNLPAKVTIGVNVEGILLLKPKEKELISSHPFTEICSWASSPSTFSFEWGAQHEPARFTFETKQGAIITSCVQTYIDILVQMLKTDSDDDDDNNSNSTE